MKLVRGHTYRGTASVPLLSFGIFTPEATGRELLEEFGFVDVNVTTTIPENWPTLHRDADVFATGKWGKETGDYEIPSFVTWIDDTTPPPKVYQPGHYWLTVQPYNELLGTDPHEKTGLEAYLHAEQAAGNLTVTKLAEPHGGAFSGGEVLLYEFDLQKPSQWRWAGLSTSLPEAGHPSQYEFEPTPGQKDWIDDEKDKFLGGLKAIAATAAGVGVGLIVLNMFLNRRRS